jgi:hypothetical protein
MIQEITSFLLGLGSSIFYGWTWSKFITSNKQEKNDQYSQQENTRSKKTYHDGFIDANEINEKLIRIVDFIDTNGLVQIFPECCQKMTFYCKRGSNMMCTDNNCKNLCSISGHIRSVDLSPNSALLGMEIFCGVCTPVSRKRKNSSSSDEEDSSSSDEEDYTFA